MQVMTSREFRRRIGKVLEGGEGVVVLKRGVPAVIVVPADSEAGRQMLASRRSEAYLRFIGTGESGEETVSEEHDAHLYR